MFSGGHMPEYFSLNDKISIDIRVCLLIKPKKIKSSTKRIGCDLAKNHRFHFYVSTQKTTGISKELFYKCNRHL